MGGPLSLLKLPKVVICSIVRTFVLLRRNPKCTIVVPGYAIGDIVFISAVIRKYKEAHPEAKFILGVNVNRKGDCAAAKLVASVFDRIEMHVPPVLGMFHFTRIHKLWPHMWSVACSDFGNENLIDLFSQLMFGKSILKKANPITVPLGDRQEDWGRYQKGKTALVCPGATSVAMPNADEIWAVVGNYLRNKGYSVVFNAKDDSHCKGFDTIFYDVKKTASFVEYGGYVISLRSGLADLLAYVTHARILAVYSHNFDDWCWTVADAWRKAGYTEAGAEFLRYWSLSGLFDREGLYDCFYEGIEDLLKQVDILIKEQEKVHSSF